MLNDQRVHRKPYHSYPWRRIQWFNKVAPRWNASKAPRGSTIRDMFNLLLAGEFTPSDTWWSFRCDQDVVVTSSIMGNLTRFDKSWSKMVYPYNVRPPSYVCWFRFAPVTIVISTINHSEIGVMFTNLAIERGPHIVQSKGLRYVYQFAFQSSHLDFFFWAMQFQFEVGDTTIMTIIESHIPTYPLVN